MWVLQHYSDEVADHADIKNTLHVCSPIAARTSVRLRHDRDCKLGLMGNHVCFRSPDFNSDCSNVLLVQHPSDVSLWNRRNVVVVLIEPNYSKTHPSKKPESR